MAINEVLADIQQQQQQASGYNYRNPEDLLSAAKAIDYNPETGEIKHSLRAKSNGSYDKDGYLIIKIKRLQWKAHRLAWAKYYGVPPAHNIDHINGNKTDNRISNLRDVPQKINNQSSRRKPNPKTKIIGVHIDECTQGLKAKYTTRWQGKAFRFRSLADAINFRLERGLRV